MPKLEDNQLLRALFSLPPIQTSGSTSIAVPEMPSQDVVTGDREVDAVLWLQRVVATGNESLIAKAMAAAERITTPMKEIAERYSDFVMLSGAHPLQVAFSTFGFGDLKDQARRAVEKSVRCHEAISRFGSLDALANPTPAEQECKKALCGLKRRKLGWFDDDQARARFARRAALVPATIADCLHVRAYWNELYRLRQAAIDNGDPWPGAWDHDTYCRWMMAQIAPRDRAEAIAAFEHATEDEGIHGTDDEVPILRNLMVSGWDEAEKYQEVFHA
ncbi:hypothetical protein [Burkholderia glumae]|uniref:hypothetical protein n=1 Tax=Burkholderia glumae TaxID=337 RepID=UPI00214F9AA9|nr:hypothetical protein [Burkholderia glumae]